MICANFESILVPEDNEKQNLKCPNLIRTNIENTLLAVMVINSYVLMIKLLNLLCLTLVKMLFTILLIV